jgi:hypothetical protein
VRAQSGQGTLQAYMHGLAEAANTASGKHGTWLTHYYIIIIIHRAPWALAASPDTPSPEDFPHSRAGVPRFDTGNLPELS